MKTSMRVEDPNSVEVTLEVTMTLNEWKMLRHKLYKANSWDESSTVRQLVCSIDDLVLMVQQRFEEDKGETP